ncbi:MAG: glycosyltransferase family 2 protein, partial [Peptostreptococcaceae bacterium]
MHKPTITVFTPTYNRGYIIQKCYESLKKQTYKNFEWLIYDDGSSDNTKEIVDDFIKENIMNIRYYYGKNSGKHVAINRGSDLARGELFFIVDSDDYLTDNSLELVKEAWESIDEKEKFVGVSGKRYLVNRQNKDFNFNEKYYDADSIKFNLIDKNLQDKAEVYSTKILKKYKFPEFDGEKFITEAVVWYKLAEEGYKIRWFNKNIYICEYLEDGLSANFFKQRINSIKGTCDSYNKLSSFNLPLKYKIRYKINYFRYGLQKYSIFELFPKLYNKQFMIIS